MPSVRLKYQNYHPSIWPKMIAEASRDCFAGGMVQVLNPEGEPFGWGFWNPRSRMPLRIFSHSKDPLDETFFERSIVRAAQLRRKIHQLDSVTNSYRAIHGDADFMPGIVADKFDSVLSVEITSLAAYQRLAVWLPILHEQFSTEKVIVRVDEHLADIEGIPRQGGVRSDFHQNIKISEHNIRYEVNGNEGHKTGFFCDQRDNRKLFGSMAEGRSVLDLCCYTGGFAISAALNGASEVTAIDLDEKAIDMAKRNANLNQTRVKFTHADAFTWMRTMIQNGKKWDLVMADPPKFIHGRDDEMGQAKYHDLNKLALQLVAPDGIFVTCSCSGMLSSEQFEHTVTSVAHRQNKRMQVFARTGAGIDHPTLSNYPESRYLKAIWSRLSTHGEMPVRKAYDEESYDEESNY